MLMREDVRVAFLARLDEIIVKADVNVIATVINKKALNESELTRENPYHIAMYQNMLLLNEFLLMHKQEKRSTHIITESRGKAEDKDLKSAFEHSVAWFKTRSANFASTPFDLRFAEKKINSAGLQLADLFAHPIGRQAIDPLQINHAFEIVRQKIFAEIMQYP